MPNLTFRDSRTFVEVLSVTKHPKKTVYYESIPDDKEWLLRSLVGSPTTSLQQFQFPCFVFIDPTKLLRSHSLSSGIDS